MQQRSQVLTARRYIPHDFEKPDHLSDFMAGCTDSFSLDSLVLNGTTGGWALDSSWRHKNENRAAVTFLITINEGMHAVPGCVLLSANTRTATLVKFLRDVKIQLRRRAIAITQDGATIEARSPEQVERIREGARKIVDDEYRMSHFMIDKCLSELYALREVFPQVPIRLCQFHAVQAIMRLECDSGDRGSPMRLSMELKIQIIYIFRELQRCRTWEGWGKAKQTFLTSLEMLVIERCEAQWNYLLSYFEQNWFTEEWIPIFTDIGLPSDQTRDGPWNTNNWVERAFRTFDGVFLMNRENKRLDRLVIVILNDFLPYYQHWQPDDREANRRLVELNYLAYQIWESDLVTYEGDGLYTVVVPA
ncbi:hypothetical protein L226DRAFT_470718 [Lentinus tigrinus ALCF2SS1-7]|uniref:MULE transposase domain-containing protein n=1 Tax=Lentinus tigrinus ALCF2SS1-6 TaxID=1328759 RepID=A0A5C2RWG1_9APHY|nr:hypothetical protein L227DRAFT_510366 [Lentinus tigrinus ALCF2SS1-6]RPD70150.1 hypothetical protein L226DRAFT_470718 [Lentinus tigrinus ALCF2SS1-7]